MSVADQFVFLHGGGQGGWVWDETIAALALQTGGHARCLALDGPGCGAKRGRDTTAMTVEDINRELVADVVAAGMQGAVLVGHSQAGMHLPHMAELAAELAPDLFGKLVFVTCSAPLPGWTTLDQMGHDIGHGDDPDRVGYPLPAAATMAERYRAMFCNDMDDTGADAFLAKLGGDGWPMACYSHSDWRRDHLRGLDASYVLCERDQALTAEWQHRFAARLHARRTYRIDAGHQVMNTRPHALAEVLLAECRA